MYTPNVLDNILRLVFDNTLKAFRLIAKAIPTPDVPDIGVETDVDEAMSLAFDPEKNALRVSLVQEVVEAATVDAPVPAIGVSIIWHDTTADKWYLVFGIDGTNVKKVELA